MSFWVLGFRAVRVRGLGLLRCLYKDTASQRSQKPTPIHIDIGSFWSNSSTRIRKGFRV